jgi:hypothetical protein
VQFHAILALHETAVTTDQPELAYHLLAAALYAAEAAQDPGLIEDVRVRADEQERRLQTTSGVNEGLRLALVSMYRSLIATARIKRAQLAAGRVAEHAPDGDS